MNKLRAFVVPKICRELPLPWSCENLKFWHIPDNFQRFYVHIFYLCDVKFRDFAEITRIECRLVETTLNKEEIGILFWTISRNLRGAAGPSTDFKGSKYIVLRKQP